MNAKVNESDAATEALIREVDEDLKRDKAEKLWKAYGSYVVAAAAILVLGVAGNEGWSHWKTSQAQDESARFAQVSRQATQGKAEDSLSGLEAMAKDGGVYGTLAEMKKAGILTIRGETAKAVESYQLAATHSGMGALYQSAAKLNALALQIDTGDSAKLEAELAPLAGASEPWRHSARELQALLAIRTGDTAKAQDIYTRLSDDATAPHGLRARAAELRQSLEAKGRS
ncbi:MAG: tetratricopeptide repeat protein [Alphaproteobacteria bacterium]|nr:tetratricopeptide repeat protein [Alphaproteobacteria bacterium]